MSTGCAIVKYSPEAISETSIGYEFGLQFRFVQVIGENQKKEAAIVKSGEKNVFIALFDREDVDFEIAIENSYRRLVKCTVTVGNSNFTYIFPKSIESSIKALKSNGQHLHFLSQNTDDGKLLVTMSAQRDGVTYDEAAVSCSRIRFECVLESSLEDTVLCRKRPALDDKNRMIIEIRDLTGRTLHLEVHPQETVETVKCLITKEEGIPLDQQRLIFDSKQMQDFETLQDHNVKANDVIHMVLRLRGGGGEPPAISVADSTSTESTSCENVGDRGVVCFGQPTQQRFTVYKETFVDSETHATEGFTVELRTKPKYTIQP